MFKPDDPLAPRDGVFTEGWHAQTLAIADTMINADQFTATQWAQTLGAALSQAEADGEPDTPETYYASALNALETLTLRSTELAQSDLQSRKSAWADAYRATPHGQPVKLSAGRS